MEEASQRVVHAILRPGEFGEFGVRVEGQGCGQFEPERVAVAAPTFLLGGGVVRGKLARSSFTTQTHILRIPKTLQVLREKGKRFATGKNTSGRRRSPAYPGTLERCSLSWLATLRGRKLCPSRPTETRRGPQQKEQVHEYRFATGHGSFPSSTSKEQKEE